MKTSALRYYLLKRLVWLRRIRHRCGYGIHSPFAFNLVTRVIYERTLFCGYEALRPLVGRTRLREKDLRLLFRLSNDLQPRHGLAFTADTAAVESLRLGCRGLHMPRTEDERHWKMWQKKADAPIDFFYTDRPEAGPLIAKAFPKAAPTLFVIVAGIHRNRSCLTAWNTLRQQPEVRVSFDLYDFGFLSLDRHYARQHYVINYL